MGHPEFSFLAQQGFDDDTLRNAKIGIYAGKGASHSWLWFVDLFEKKGFVNLFFLDENLWGQNSLEKLDVLIISGGDTFAVAEALGKQGARKISGFVENGGIYIGSCAGAYLPMKSSKEPLHLFNFVDVKITNLAKVLPESLRRNSKSFATYGCDYIFHPVRESVKLRMPNHFYDSGLTEFHAPLYGGPGMTHDHPENILAYYDDFTEKTSFLVSRQYAENTLIGKAAVVRVPYREGCFYLFGPHLEHPGYQAANNFLTTALLKELSEASGIPAFQHHSSKNTEIQREVLSGQAAAEIIRNMKRELSNSRIAASGLEFYPVKWVIGKKVYEPEKIRVFLEAMWKRVKSLEKGERLVGSPGVLSFLVENMASVTKELRQIKNGIDQNLDTLEIAISVFERLQKLSINFFDVVFQSIREGQRENIGEA